MRQKGLGASFWKDSVNDFKIDCYETKTRLERRQNKVNSEKKREKGRKEQEKINHTSLGDGKQEQ